MASIKRKFVPMADAHVIARATLVQSDFDAINAEVQKGLREAAERVAAAAQATALAAPARTLPPLCNTGGKKFQLVTEGGKLLELTERKHSENEVCFIDWLHITCHESSFQLDGITDEHFILDVSRTCESIFGFGITAKRDRGMHFYKTSFELGDKYGHVCHGGQRNTVLIQLTGTGCAAAKYGWERRLYEFLQSSVVGKITRIDLAHDDYQGKYHTPESLEKAYDDGHFNAGGRNPDVEMRGNWKNPNGKGRTLYVGTRGNGKSFRGYEKGKQLGCATSPWMRYEVEFLAKSRVVPLECLIRPQDYFAAAYPLLSTFSDRAERILTTQKTVQACYERTKTWLKHQCGAALNLMFQIEGDAKKVLDLVMREGKLPDGIKVPSYLDAGEFLHNLEKTVFPMAAYYESFDLERE